MTRHTQFSTFSPRVLCALIGKITTFFFQVEVGVLTQIQEECPPFCTLWTSCFDKPNGHNYAASMHGH